MNAPVTPQSPWGGSGTSASREWARHGHTDTATELTSVYRTGSRLAPGAKPVEMRFSRRTGQAVGTILLAVVALGSAGSAIALREALFPETGDAATRSVWQNPGHDRDADPAGAGAPRTTPSTSSTTTPHSATSTVPTTVPAPASTPARSGQMDNVGGDAVPVVSADDERSSVPSTPSSSRAGDDDRDGGDDAEDDDSSGSRSGTSDPNVSDPNVSDSANSGSGSGDDSDDGDSGSDSSGPGSSGSGSDEDPDDDGGDSTGDESGGGGSGSSGSDSDDD